MSLIIHVAMWIALVAWVASLSIMALLLAADFVDGIQAWHQRRRFRRQLDGRRPW